MKSKLRLFNISTSVNQ